MTCRGKVMTSGVLYQVEVDDHYCNRHCGFLPRPPGTGLHNFPKALG